MPGKQSTQIAPYEKGGAQGRINSPDDFAEMMRSVLCPLIHSWRTRGHLLAIPFDGKHIFTLPHLWANNIYMFADNWRSWHIMMYGLTAGLEHACLRWNRDSLQILVSAGNEVVDSNDVNQVLSFPSLRDGHAPY